MRVIFENNYYKVKYLIYAAEHIVSFIKDKQEHISDLTLSDIGFGDEYIGKIIVTTDSSFIYVGTHSKIWFIDQELSRSKLKDFVNHLDKFYLKYCLAWE